MTVWSCSACGIEHPDTPSPPAVCPVCGDGRQFVPSTGQRWTTRQELAEQGHRTRLEELEPDLWALTVEPEVGIGQRGLLLRTPYGNVLWEPPGYLDDAAVAQVYELGGLVAVTASHPHLVGAAVSWAREFGAPFLVASADRAWVLRPDPAVQLWHGTYGVVPGVTLVQCGGHFAGSCVLHWPPGAHGRGVLLTGDTIAARGDGQSVTAMRSYVHAVPLPERAIRRILQAVEPLSYDRLYALDSAVDRDARTVVAKSFAHYLTWLRGDLPDEPDR